MFREADVTKYLMFLALLTFADTSLACAMPKSGDKYDALIEVKKAKTEHHTNEYGYTVKLPSYVEGKKLSFASFYITDLNEKEFGNHIRIPIEIKNDGKFSIGYVAVRGKLSSKITVSVGWGGICPIGADKTIKHNQSKQ